MQNWWPSVLALFKLAVFPLWWPWNRLSVGASERRYRAVAQRREATDLVGRVEAGHARSAALYAHETHAMASGAEDDSVIEVELPDGPVVVWSTRALREALARAGVPTREERSEDRGVGAVAGWLLCAAMVAAIATWALTR